MEDTGMGYSLVTSFPRKVHRMRPTRASGPRVILSFFVLQNCAIRALTIPYGIIPTSRTFNTNQRSWGGGGADWSWWLVLGTATTGRRHWFYEAMPGWHPNQRAWFEAEGQKWKPDWWRQKVLTPILSFYLYFGADGQTAICLWAQNTGFD